MQRDGNPGPGPDDDVERDLQEMERASRDRLEDWPERSPSGAAPEGDVRGTQPQTVADVMTRPAVTMPVEASVVEAAETMRDNDIGGVLAAEGDLVQGFVTDRDLVVRVIAEGLDPTTTTVGDVCSAELLTTHPSTPVDEAVRLMRDAAVRRLPVIDDEGRALGLVSLGDVALARDPRSAVADISAAPPNT